MTREQLVAFIAYLESEKRYLTDELEHARSSLRNDLEKEGKKSWRNADYEVRFLAPRMGLKKMGLGRFKRVPLDPYLKVRKVS